MSAQRHDLWYCESMDEHQESRSATQVLMELSAGDRSAARRLMPVVYDRLRAMAGAYVRSQRPDHTLDPTALVHEAFLKLVDQSRVGGDDRAHFFAVAARAMRLVLADHARRKGAAKRGGHDQERVTLAGAAADTSGEALDLIALDDALTKLTALNERHAQMVELRFFSGMSVDETATAMGVSKSTVESDWRLVRAWLSRELGAGRSDL